MRQKACELRPSRTLSLHPDLLEIALYGLGRSWSEGTEKPMSPVLLPIKRNLSKAFVANSALTRTRFQPSVLARLIPSSLLSSTPRKSAADLSPTARRRKH